MIVVTFVLRIRLFYFHVDIDYGLWYMRYGIPRMGDSSPPPIQQWTRLTEMVGLRLFASESGYKMALSV
jgi:hypothetical protein